MPRGGQRLGAGRPKGQGKFGEPTRPLRIPESLVDDVLEWVAHKGYRVPLYACKISAGFPSPTEDYVEGKLDLNDYLIKNPAATFLVRATGDSMLGAGIHPGDLLVVDRSIKPNHDHIVIAAIDGELTVKRLRKQNNEIALCPENDRYTPIQLSTENDLVIWGVVTSVIHRV